MITLLLCSLVACGSTNVLLPGTPGAAPSPPTVAALGAGSNAAALQVAAGPAGRPAGRRRRPPERTARSGGERPAAGGRLAGTAGCHAVARHRHPPLPRRQPAGPGQQRRAQCSARLAQPGPAGDSATGARRPGGTGLRQHLARDLAPALVGCGVGAHRGRGAPAAGCSRLPDDRRQCQAAVCTLGAPVGRGLAPAVHQRAAASVSAAGHWVDARRPNRSASGPTPGCRWPPMAT